jgi:hypothetical protein
MAAPNGPMRPTSLNADGTFRLSGIIPGKLRVGTMNETVKGLSTTRVELNGANVLGGFDVTEGAQITGVNIVMTFGTAAVVGQTTYVNGAPAQNARVMAFARLVGTTPGPTSTRSAPRPGGGGPMRPRRSEPQRVVVGEGGETKVSPVIDFK